jgi:hypothetical protein
MKGPLYAIHAGTFGDDATAAEHNLRIVLDIVPKWNAILLIDEWDSFLQKRSRTDLHRNKLVSVFL